MSTALKLTYFAGTGRAELTRLILHCGGLAFEDERLSIEEFLARKPSLPLGQLPILHVNDKTYSQSIAIARYAAKLSGLYPQDPVRALRADMISDTLSDFRVVYTAILRTQNESAKPEMTTKMLEESVPKTFGALESFVEGAFFLGDSVSYADVQLYDIVTNGLRPNFPGFSSSVYPKLERVIANVEAIPNIAAYLATQKK
ncbi:Hematopoietic prostaglandin d synthase, partial [Globisporangium splendens]